MNASPPNSDFVASYIADMNRPPTIKRSRATDATSAIGPALSIAIGGLAGSVTNARPTAPGL